MFFTTYTPLLGQFKDATLVVIKPENANGQFDTTNILLSDDGTTVSFLGRSSQFLSFQAVRFTEDYGVQPLGTVGSSFNGTMSSIFDISADGSVIVGSGTVGGKTTPVMWTEADGLLNLKSLPESSNFGGSSATFVSANGSVIVLQLESSFPQFGFEDSGYRYSSDDGFVNLGDVPGGSFGFVIRGISADGGVIVGRGFSADGYEAVRYTPAEGLQVLPDDPRIVGINEISGVSADGSVIFGTFSIPRQISGIYRYTDVGGYEVIGIPENNFISLEGMSSDGSVVFGSILKLGGNQLFRYTNSTGVEFIDGAVNHRINGISANGSVFVGVNNETVEAYRYNITDGFQTIGEWLSASGVSVDTALDFISASDVSADGNVVVGTLIDTSKFAFLPYLARGASGAIAPEEFAQSFGTTASIQQVANLLPSTVLNGSHHRTLLDQAQLTKDNSFWVVGDFTSDNRRDADVVLGEVGVAHDFALGVRGGIALGHAALEQDLSNNGSQQIDGQYLYGEIDYKLPDTTVVLSLAALYGQYDADITRGYLNAGLPDSSQGDTDLDSTSIRLRADWVDMMRLGGLGISSRIAYTYTRLETDAYTETGGGFPVVFNEQSHDIHELRVGLTGKTQLNKTTTFRTIVEGVYRADNAGSNFSGNVIGLFNFNIQGANTRQAWARLGIEVEHMLDENRAVSASLFGSTRGEDPQISGGLNFSYGF